MSEQSAAVAALTLSSTVTVRERDFSYRWPDCLGSEALSFRFVRYETSEATPSLDVPRLMLLFRHDLLESLPACRRIDQGTLDILDRFRCRV